MAAILCQHKPPTNCSKQFFCCCLYHSEHYAHYRKTHKFRFLSQKTFSVALTWKRIIDCILPKWQRCRPRSDYPERYVLKRFALFRVVTGLLMYTKFRLREGNVWPTPHIWIIQTVLRGRGCGGALVLGKLCQNHECFPQSFHPYFLP